MGVINVVFGAGGVAREVSWLIHDVAIAAGQSACADLFVSVDQAARPSIDGAEVILESNFFCRSFSEVLNIYLAVGSPSVKCKMLDAIERAGINCTFPNIFHPRSVIDARHGSLNVGRGIIVYPSAAITTNVTLGDFVTINPNVTVAHDTNIGSFSTICPGVHVSGGVTIGRGCFIGAGSVIKEGIHIVEDCLIGAGSVVTRPIDIPGVWYGNPARRKL